VIFSCELTSTGCLVTWTGPLLDTEHIVFYAGRDSQSQTERFTATTSPGSETFTLADDNDVLLPNLSGHLDVFSATDDLVRTSGLRPLVPGLTAKDVRLLFKLASDHTRSCLLRGATAHLYRKRKLGTACINCCDPVSGIQMTSDCNVCGGSGFAEGWLGPFVTPVLFLLHKQEDTAAAGGGAAQELAVEMIRLKAFPRPRAQDYLFIPSSRQTYIMGHPQKTVAGVAGVPAVVDMQARLPNPDTAEAVIPDTW
jgi:hypothetical protein